MLLGKELAKYQRTLPTAEEIGRDLEAKVKERFGGRRAAALELSKKMRRAVGTAEYFIRECLEGGVSNFIYPPNTPREEKQVEIDMQSLGFFYKMLGIRRKDPIVARTRKINPNFRYN